MSFGSFANNPPSDFLLDLAKGKVPGHETRLVSARLPVSAGGVFEEVWSEGGFMSMPTGAETWEILSTDVTDTAAAGVGAQFVSLAYLDTNYEVKTIVAALDGTTPVQLNSDHFRPENSVGISPGGCLVIGAGATRTNVGKIIVRQSGGGPIRQTIPPGLSTSQNIQYTVPAGKTAYATANVFYFPKDNDGAVRSVVTPNFPGAPKLYAGQIPFYQNAFLVDFASYFGIPAEADAAFEVNLTNAGANASVQFTFILVDGVF